MDIPVQDGSKRPDLSSQALIVRIELLFLSHHKICHTLWDVVQGGGKVPRRHTLSSRGAYGPRASPSIDGQ